MNGNFKARCVECGPNIDLYTLGKVYEFRNGSTVTDNGNKMPAFRISSFEQWEKYSCSKWELVEDSKMENNEKTESKGFLHCKICKRRFALVAKNRYTAITTDSIFPLRTTAHDAFNCPHCGCQNIVGIRVKEEVKNNE